MFRIQNVPAALLIFALAACSGGDTTSPNNGGNNGGNSGSNGGGGGGVVPPVAVASIALTPAEFTLQAGANQQLAVVMKDADGTVLSGRTLTYASSATSIATVSQTGLVTAVASGPATISVTSEGKSASATVTVQPAPPAAVAAVVLTPPNAIIDAGESMTLQSRVVDVADNTLTGRTVTWTSSNNAIATVDANGKVTAVSGGMVRITATSEGVAAEAAIQVRRVVASVQVVGALDTLEAYDVRGLRAVAKDAAGIVIDDIHFTWTSSNPSVATVQSPMGVIDGTITGVDRGTVTITATSPNGKSGTATRVVVIKYRSITAGTMHTCDIASGGVAYCWGLNSTDARLGDADVGDGKFRSTPFKVPGDRHYKQLVTFARFTCGLKTDGKVWCWGSNSWGTLGDGTSKYASSTPVQVAGNNVFTTIAAGADHACGITTANAMVCWGHNDWGQFGIGNTSSPDFPVVAAGGMQFRAVMASTSSTCGIAMNGSAYCWGGNGLGQTGDGLRIAYGNVYKTAPSLVVGGLTFAAITGGQSYACGLTTGNQAWCWGSNGGRFGSGNTTDSSSPVAVSGGHAFSMISSGFAHSCGVTLSDEVACWGANGNGQIGTTSLTLRVPYLMAGFKAAEVTASGIGTGAGSHSCAISKDRLTVSCWGRNDVGQLGNGNTTPMAAVNATPSIVIGQKPL